MTHQQAVDGLAQYEAALLAISTGSSYSIGGRSLTRADFDEVMAGITYFRRQLKYIPDPDAPEGTVGMQTYLTPRWS